MILRKGDACIQCREHKVKCNGLKPICSRCHRLRKECAYPAGRARRRPLVELLEARALQLQLQVNKVALSSSHDFSIASVRLGERIRLLGDMSGQIRTPANAAWLPIYPAFGDEERDTMQSQKNDVTGNVIERFIAERRLASFTWTTGEELPSSMSQYLIRLFLPYRLQHYFFMDVSHFLHCLALPLDHPESIHPCLRHACHLAACNVIGGRFALLEPYFIDRTRYFLHQSLMFVDRVPHFLWASLLLGYCLAKKRRLEESYVIFTAACQLATACGLYEHADHRAPPSTPLLPPPRNPIEAMDRIWLVHSLYLGDQALSAISAFPGSFVVERVWESTLGDSPKEFSSYKVR
ncbi:hypothetical protein DL93DRAFT_1689920 [Clavulina sp. PMI_390]|nr:hypothetical protein DL93DRAFT_1689920 [Clavulina sp. PMI_390]